MLMYIIIFLLALIVFSYFGYPVVIFIMSLFSKSTIKKDPNYLPTVSFQIAAYNEENFIAEKIKNALETNYPKENLEIVVVSDGSTDKTDEIVKSFSHLGVKLIRVEGRVGKTEARNQSVKMTTAEVIVFSDATAIYHPNAIRALVQNLADPSVGMVSGNLEYVNQANSGMGLATRLYWAYESTIKRSQSKMRTLTGAIGCINAFKTKLYIPLPPNIIEDFTEPLMILAQDYRIVYEKEAISNERTTQKPSQEFAMRVRVIRGGMKGFLFAMRKFRLIKHYDVILQLLCHKVSRWLMPIYLIILYLVSLIDASVNQNTFSHVLYVLQNIFYIIALLGLYIKPKGIVGKLLSIPTYFVIVNAASLKAFYLTMTQDLEATWDTNTY